MKLRKIITPIRHGLAIAIVLVLCGSVVTNPNLSLDPQVNIAYSQSKGEVFSDVPVIPCDGVEQFYTNTSLAQDLKTIRTNYSNLSWTGTDETHYRMATPKELTYLEWDCEDLAHAAFCLNQYYKEGCMYYTYIRTYFPSLDKDIHLGYTCWLNGKWVDLV